MWFGRTTNTENAQVKEVAKVPATTFVRVNSIDELYKDGTLYTSQDMFSPPSERLPHVLRFELTEGCDWGKCTYCGGFDGIRAREKPFEEFKGHVDRVWEKIGPKTALAMSITRVFVGGGNALSVEANKLKTAVDYVLRTFEKNTGGYVPKRISIYGRTPTIAEKIENLGDLKYIYKGNGINLIYWGLESGSHDVLTYVRKGCNKDQLECAVQTLRRSNMDSSVMIMPGLGGFNFYESHVNETAKILSELRPRFITFMGINPCPTSEYAKRMNSEQAAGTNRPLTDKEMVTQIANILEKTSIGSSKVGCFPTNIDGVGHNPLPFGSVSVGSNISKETLVSILRNAAVAIKN